MRVLLGGVVGAAAAAAVWMALEHNAKQEFNWMAIAVGLITGLAVHYASGAGSRSSFGRGILAVVLTLVVCVGSRQAYAKFMAKSGLNEPSALAEGSGGTSDPDAKEVDSETSDQPAELVIPADFSIDSGAVGLGNVSFKQSFSEWDMLWLSSAALVAYIAGKGRDRTPATEAEDESPEPESAE